MKRNLKLLGTLILVIAFSIIALMLFFHFYKSLPAMNTKELLGNVGGLDIEIMVQNPSTQETPLQIVYLFQHSEDSPNKFNGLTNVDEAFNGLITDLRRTNRFEGKFLETLLIIPPENTIPAKKLMLIGLGNKADFKPELMKMIGITAIREALRLNVNNYSQAGDLKEAGIDSPVDEIAGNITEGAIEGLRTQKFLRSKNASDDLSVKKVVLLSTSEDFEASKEGIKKVIRNWNKNVIYSNE